MDWLQRAATLAPERAVHPDTRWLGYDLWARRMLQRWTLARLAGRRYRLAVDLGCGYGDWTARFAELADEVRACELAPELAARARAAVAPYPRAFVACCDVRDFAVPRGFDLLYAGAVFMYLPDADVLDVLRRARAAAASGALVVVRDFCAYGRGRRAEQDGTIYRRARELAGLVVRAGFAVSELRASPSIYGELMGGWPLRILWRLATLHWARASYTLVSCPA